MIDEIFLICPYCNKKLHFSHNDYIHCTRCVTINQCQKYRIWHDNFKITGYELWNETEKYYLYSFEIYNPSYSKIRIFNSKIRIFNSKNTLESIYEIKNIFIPLKDKVTDDLLNSFRRKIIVLNAFQ